MTDFIDFAAIVRPAKPNTYLVAPAGYCDQARPDDVSPMFRVPPDQLFGAILAVIETMGSAQQLDQDPTAGAICFVDVTKVFRFKDDVDLRVLPTPDGATLAIYSRSRVGYSDMGANKKRVDGLLAAVHAATAAG